MRGSEFKLVTKKRILIVDDEQINLEFFDVMLTKLGFDVQKAEDGQEALEAIRRLRPDLVLLDNIMPRLSGWEVTKILKSSPEFVEFADTPIIVFSALDDVKDKVEALELGADDYITKPFNFAEVLARIRAVLRSHELIGQIENRDRRIVIGDKALGEFSLAFAKAKKALGSVAKAGDLESAKALAEEARAVLVAVEKKIEALGAETESLRKEAHDIATIRKRNRAEAH